MELSPLSRVYIKRIQICINVLNNTTFDQLLKTFPNTVTRISICYSSCTPKNLSHLTKELNRNLKVVVGKKTFCYAIIQDDTVNLRSMLFYYLEHGHDRLSNTLTPLQLALMKKPYSIEDFRKHLHVTSISARNTIKAKRPRLMNLKKYCKVLKLPFKATAKAYGYKTVTVHKKALNSALIKLRIDSDLKQADLASLLHVHQAEISRIEHGGPAGFNTLMNYVKLFKIKPYKLIKHLKRYHNLSINSPSYALINILYKKQLSIPEMAHFAKIGPTILRKLILNNQSSNDYISENYAKRIICNLSLPKDTFKGLSRNYYHKEFIEYQHKSGLTENNFSYRLNKIRCLHHYSLRRFAKFLGCTPEWIEYLIYQHRTRVQLRLKIASAFPEDADYLLNITHQLI